MDDKADLLAIIAEEFRRRPHAGPDDLRKLVFQSVFGIDHLLADPKRFRQELEEEWRLIPGERSDDRAIQIIDPVGRTARLHLSPCKARGIPIGSLAGLLAGQAPKGGSRQAFLSRWQDVVDLSASGRIPLDPQPLSELAALEGLSHHSEGYGFVSYRVVNDVRIGRLADELRAWGLLS